MISLRSAKSRIVLGLFVISLFSAFVFSNEMVFADCGGGYCYSTGHDPLGGRCGNGADGPYWDTCFGLSWQYYEWPENYTGDISFHGTHNAGYATVSGQCAEYGGFWFLGYEVYNPRTGNSYGYQVGAPRARMLRAYDPTNGYTSLFYSKDRKPANNPYIRINGSYLRAQRYGNLDDMAAIEAKFNEYEREGKLVVNEGENGFSDVNWFCSAPIPPEDADNAFNGQVIASVNNVYRAGDYSNDGEASESNEIYINEGESVEITFEEKISGTGQEPQNVPIRIYGSFRNGPGPNNSELGMYNYAYDYTTRDRDGSVYYHSYPVVVGTKSQVVSEAGDYCESLAFSFGEDDYSYTACVKVRVVPTPPDFYGRVTASATVLDDEDGTQTSAGSATTDWNGTSVVVVPVQIHYGQSVTVSFMDEMKGEGANPAQVKFTLTNDFAMNERRTGSFIYNGSTASGESRQIGERQFDGISKDATICETLRFIDERGEHVASACVEITKVEPKYPELKRESNKNGDFNYSVEVDPQISVTLQQPLVTATGGVETFLRDKTTVRVASNNLTGYSAVMTTGKNSSDANATSLVHDDVLSGESIQTLSSNVSRSEFPSDRWGFSFDDTTEGNNASIYRPVVALDSAQPILVLSNNSPAIDTKDVYFATKAGAERPSGSYTNSIVVRATANVLPVDTAVVSDITYMQEINDSVIESMVVGTQYQLRDQRDNKDYWVVKLEDGNVWMSQNLDLNLPQNNSDQSVNTAYYTNATTDLTYGDSLGQNVSPAMYTTSFGRIGLYRAASDINIGKSAMFSNSGSCVGVGCTVYDVTPYDYYIGSDDLIGAHYQDDQECADVLGISISDCSHYHIGVMYSGSLATKLYSSKVTSVCPRGWRLPESDDFTSLQNLIDTRRSNDSSLDVFEAVPELYLVGDVHYSLTATTLHSVRGTKAFWLSNTYNMSNSSYGTLAFFTNDYTYTSSEYLSNDNFYPVRCVARTGNN